MMLSGQFQEGYEFLLSGNSGCDALVLMFRYEPAFRSWIELPSDVGGLLSHFLGYTSP